MTKYLISFPSEAMQQLTAEDLALASVESHVVIEEAKAAGVYVFGGGVDETVDPVLIAADGTVSTATYPNVKITGGLLVLELPGREAAEAWASKVAAACRCSQELRAFGFDPQS
jgi:hypothetical protein